MTNYGEKQKKWSFLAVFLIFKKLGNFRKLKKTFLIDLEWSTLAKGKVAISKTVATVASRYTHTNIIIIPTEYKNHIHKSTKSLSVCKCISGDWFCQHTQSCGHTCYYVIKSEESIHSYYILSHKRHKDKRYKGKYYEKEINNFFNISGHSCELCQFFKSMET